MKASRESARSFSVVEEEFFAGSAQVETTQPIETFADLDEGYRPVSLWQRLFGKKK
jgi:hypothetical protein